MAPAFFEWLDHPDDGPYWDYLRIESRYDRVRIPVLNLSGWHDEGYGPNGAAHNFLGTRQWGGRLVIGPWTHGTPTPKKTRVGAIDFGKDAGLDYFALLLRFFDRWLKGVPNGIDREAPVRIFVMGDNVWRDETEWPLARARPTAYYLQASGRLATDPPASPSPPTATSTTRPTRSSIRTRGGSGPSTRARSRRGATCSSTRASRSRATSRSPARSRSSCGRARARATPTSWRGSSTSIRTARPTT